MMTDVSSESIADQDRSALSALARAMQPFRDISKSIPASGVAAFCFVAMREGKTISDHARMSGVSLTSMSRLIADMSDTNRYGGTGLGLIDQRADWNDRRQVVCSLTPKGKVLAHRVATAIAPKA
jgi:DNA-binding MarR family transcriptional regulator